MQHKSKITYFFALEVRRMVLNGFRINICQKIFSMLIEHGIKQYYLFDSTFYFMMFVVQFNILIIICSYVENLPYPTYYLMILSEIMYFGTWLKRDVEKGNRFFIWHTFFFNILHTESYNNSTIHSTYLLTQNFMYPM